MKQTILFITITLLWSCKPSSERLQINSIEALKEETRKLFNNSTLTGYSAIVIDENSILYKDAQGFADIKTQQKYTYKTVQNIASVSKTIIAVSLMKAVDLGFLQLDEDINIHLPFKVENPNFPNTKITPRHLATHTSSILDGDNYIKSYYFYNISEISKEDLSEDFHEYYDVVKGNELIDDSEFLNHYLNNEGDWFTADHFSSTRPGEVSEYSNVGASLAAYVIERASGLTYEAFTQKYIFDPLGMIHTSWEKNDLINPLFATRYFTKENPVPDYYLITKADGGLYTNTQDFAKFMMEMIKGFNGKGSLLSKDAYKEMFSEQIVIEEDELGGIFWVLGPNAGGFRHNGSDPGVSTMVSYNAEKERALVLFSNIESTQESYGQLAELWNLYGRYNFKKL